jgi:hypothetical protein
MTKKLFAAAALIAGLGMSVVTASPTLARPIYHHHHYYDFWPGRGHGRPYVTPDYMRGGPGPRVFDGCGAGIGCVR